MEPVGFHLLLLSSAATTWFQVCDNLEENEKIPQIFTALDLTEEILSLTIAGVRVFTALSVRNRHFLQQRYIQKGGRGGGW